MRLSCKKGEETLLQRVLEEATNELSRKKEARFLSLLLQVSTDI
jgi:hypothetical protein